MRPATLLPLVLLLAGACDCDGQGLTQLVPLLSPDAARVPLPGVYLGASGEATLLYHSSGTGIVDIGSVALEDANAEGFALVDAGAKAVEPGDALRVRVSFTPVAVGPASVSVVVDSDADNAPTRILLEAEGLAPLDCGPTTTCQRRTFMPETGECLIEDLAGPCDDDNACTEDDACFQGECVGRALSCPSPHSCTQGLCDPVAGCVLLAHDDRCEDDDNPCTLERCDLEQGCVREELGDGIPCGPTPNCASASLCYSGACTVFDVPDGTPCNDGDFCTVDDECLDGECGGTRVERTPEIAGEARLFGTEGGLAALLSGRRVLFLDPHTSGANVAAAVDVSGAYGGYVATVVQADEDGLQVLAQTDFPGERLPARILEASPGVVVAFTSEEGVRRARRFEIATDGVVTLTATSAPLEALGSATALPDGRVVVTGPENRIWLLEPSDLSHTMLAELPMESDGVASPIKRIVAFAGGVVAALPHALSLVSLEGDVSTAADELRLLHDVASDGDTLAAARCGSSACEVILFDTSFGELSRIPAGHSGSRRVALDGGRLVVGRDGPTTAYDVSDPDAPVTLAQTLPWSAASHEQIAFRDGLGIFVAERSAARATASSLVVMLGDDGLAFLTHPRWGSPGALQAQGERLLAASHVSVHHVDVSAQGAPLVLAGAPLPRPVGSVSSYAPPLVLSNGAASMPVPLGAISRSRPIRVYEMSVPALPPHLARTLTLPIGGRVASNRRLLVGVDGEAPVEQALLIFDLVSLPPEEETSLAPRAVTPLLWSLEDIGTSTTPALSIDDANQIAVVSAPTTEVPARAELLLFDATTPEGPVLVGREVLEMTEPEPLLGGLTVAVAGPAVAITELISGTVRILRRLPDSAIVEVMRFGSDKTKILRFDGRTLVLGGTWGRELAFWDVSGAAPIDLSTVQLPDEPVDAEPFADTLVVSGQSSLVTLDPPCPPLP